MMYKEMTDSDVSYGTERLHLCESNMPSTFGKRLEELLSKTHTSQSAFSKLFSKYMQSRKLPEDKRKHSFSQQQISAYVKELNTPSLEIIIGAAHYFSVSPLYMAGLSDDPKALAMEIELSPDERRLLLAYRTNPMFKATSDHLIGLSSPSEILGLPDKSDDQSSSSSSGKTPQG